MKPIKATYVKQLVSKKSFQARSIGYGYVLLDDSGAGMLVGFSFVQNRPIPDHLQICNDYEWDKCHEALSQDKKCQHKKWHEMNCSHINSNEYKCDCNWKQSCS